MKFLVNVEKDSLVVKIKMTPNDEDTSFTYEVYNELSDSDYLDMINQYNIGDTIMMRIIRNNNSTYLAFTIN